MPRQELEVQALWHQQVHQSRLSTLAFSADGASLWCGCDAAAPRPGPAEQVEEPPVVEVSCSDGSTLRSSSGLPACNVRMLQPLREQGALLCVTGDGGFVTLGAGSGGEEGPTVLRLNALPGTPAATAAAAGCSAPLAAEAGAGASARQAATAGAPASQAATATAVAHNGTLEERTEAPAAGNRALQPPDGEPGEGEGACKGGTAAAGDSVGTGPEFEAESGYRGHREGYLFRVGAKGVGYYRKDVVRLCCPSAAAVQPVAATPALAAEGVGEHAAAAAAPGPHHSSSSSSRAAGGAQGGQEQQQRERAGQQQAAERAGQERQRREAEEARRYIQRLLSAPPSMHSVVLSPCGVLLYTSSLGPKDCSIRVWGLLPSSPAAGSGSGSGSACASVLQPELHRTLTGHSAPVLSLALTPDARLLLSGSYDRTIRVWSTADWHCVRVLKGHGGGVRALAVAPDGATLYSAAADNTIRAWSMQHWVCLRTLHGRHDDTTWPACLALSPDGSLLASGSTGPFGASTIKVFQTSSGGGREAGACLASFAQLGYLQKAGMTALLFSSDGSILYSGASDGTLAAWRLSWRAAPAGSSGGGLRRGFL